MDEPLCTTVPEDLKRLVRMIVRGFYSMEHALIIDMLVRHPCVKEEDLSDLLKYEKKHLRAILNMLKTEKFLKNRMRVETDLEGTTTRHTYYFINYSVFVNVVKYKLDHMRRKIETEERDSTARSSFRCPNCGKTFTDYEVGQLLEPSTGELLCTYCNTVVEEDQSSIPKQDARTVMARFNEQIQPVYNLLQACEDVRLAPEVLDPEPTDLKRVMNRSENRTRTEGERSTWSGEATRNIGFGFSENRVTISMDEEGGKVEKRAQPIWMTQSTVDGSLSNGVDLSRPEPDKKALRAGNNDVLQTLLAHESSSQAPSASLGLSHQDPSDSEDQPDEVSEMGSEEEDDTGPLVLVGGHRVPYHSITSEQVLQMSTLEKEEYIRTGQQLYEAMCD